MADNIYQQQATPVKPQSLAQQRIYVYVEEAGYNKKGIASFNSNDFTLNNGLASINWPYADERPAYTNEAGLVRIKDNSTPNYYLKFTDDENPYLDVDYTKLHDDLQDSYDDRYVQQEVLASSGTNYVNNDATNIKLHHKYLSTSVFGNNETDQLVQVLSDKVLLQSRQLSEAGNYDYNSKIRLMPEIIEIDNSEDYSRYGSRVKLTNGTIDLYTLYRGMVNGNGNVNKLVKINNKAVATEDDINTLSGRINTNADNITLLGGRVTTVEGDIVTINSKIPAQASADNKLADKAFVNSTVQTATANFRGNWENWEAVPTDTDDYPEDYAGSRTPTTNDYIAIRDASDYPVAEGEEPLEGTWRFKYTGDWETNGKNGWRPEYQVNETPLTAAQLAALNSGITAQGLQQIQTDITNLQTNKLNKNLGSDKAGKFLTIKNDGDIDAVNLPSDAIYCWAGAGSTIGNYTYYDIYQDQAHTTQITPEVGKIYIDQLGGRTMFAKEYNNTMYAVYTNTNQEYEVYTLLASDWDANNELSMPFSKRGHIFVDYWQGNAEGFTPSTNQEVKNNNELVEIANIYRVRRSGYNLVFTCENIPTEDLKIIVGVIR